MYFQFTPRPKKLSYSTARRHTAILTDVYEIKQPKDGIWSLMFISVVAFPARNIISAACSQGLHFWLGHKPALPWDSFRDLLLALSLTLYQWVPQNSLVKPIVCQLRVWRKVSRNINRKLSFEANVVMDAKPWTNCSCKILNMPSNQKGKQKKKKQKTLRTGWTSRDHLVQTPCLSRVK